MENPLAACTPAALPDYIRRLEDYGAKRDALASAQTANRQAVAAGEDVEDRHVRPDRSERRLAARGAVVEDRGGDAAYDGPAKLAFNGRPRALKRLFGNLIDNAVKYGRR